MKIRQVGAAFFHTEGWVGRRTERHDKLNSTYLSEILQTRLKIDLSEVGRGNGLD